jgi:putative membrane protein
MSEEANTRPEGAMSVAEEPTRDLRLVAALVRTALSAETSLMAWIRTSLSLLTFGFSIAQFFHYLNRQQDVALVSAAPRRLGISLICVGIFVLLLSIFEYMMRIRRMKDDGLPADARSFLPLGSAVALLVIGILALASVFLKWHL